MISVRILPEAFIDDPDIGSYTRPRIVEYAVFSGESPHRGAVELFGDLVDMMAMTVSIEPVINGEGSTMSLGEVIAAAYNGGTLDVNGIDIADILEAIE